MLNSYYIIYVHKCQYADVALNGVRPRRSRLQPGDKNHNDEDFVRLLGKVIFYTIAITVLAGHILLPLAAYKC
ncbi:MAG: hypothetical protein PUF72_07985 [Clostridiales bacterium]|nr:hypothetical protein [Clostridiales bacterium]